MNVLAVGAHPDDVEYGCGGTLLKLAGRGDQVHLLVLTDGGAGGNVKKRRKEQERAAEIMGAASLAWGGFSDTQLAVDKKLIDLIEKAAGRASAEEVYVNYPEDTHQDHRNLASCCMTAGRYVKKVFFYEDYTSFNFEPDVFVDIESVLDKKMDLLAAHRSQVSRAYPTRLDMVESVRAIANFRGFQAKVKYAEGFKPFRMLREI